MRITTTVTALDLRHPLRWEYRFFADDAAALGWLHQWVVTSWCDLWCEDGTGCGVEACVGVAEDVRDLDADHAIAVYFAHRRDECSWKIAPHDVEIDLPAQFTGLVEALRAVESATRHTDDPPARRLHSAVRRALAETNLHDPPKEIR